MYNASVEALSELPGLIGEAFTWSSTREGHEWWRIVHARTIFHMTNRREGRRSSYSDGSNIMLPPKEPGYGMPYRSSEATQQLRKAADIIHNFTPWNYTSEGVDFWDAVHQALQWHAEQATLPDAKSLTTVGPTVINRKNRLLLLDETSTTTKGADKLPKSTEMARLS